jgi:hypothetical protein
VSAICPILSQCRFIIPQPYELPKSSHLRFAADQPNERWQPRSPTGRWPTAPR